VNFEMKKQIFTLGLISLLSACIPDSSAVKSSLNSSNPETANNSITVPKKTMGFFVSSTGLGKGANLGGLTGADAHCQKLAETVGSKKTWKAYLSTSTENARDRIGKGPWYNAKEVMIAKNVDELHKAETNMINKTNGLNEKGEIVNGRGDTPNRHDILTGSTPDGKVSKDQTCGDWTLDGEGAAMTGHHDRIGLNDDDASKSWNSSHASRGCSQENLQSTGGDGLLYCFASN
jgi:hypothetical protein